MKINFHQAMLFFVLANMPIHCPIHASGEAHSNTHTKHISHVHIILTNSVPALLTHETLICIKLLTCVAVKMTPTT